MMHTAVKKFLFLYHHLSLPGIGSFSIEKKSACINLTDRVIEPPASQIKFSTESFPAERSFYNFLSNELHVDEAQAVHSFEEFNVHLQSDIRQNKTVALNGIGILNSDDDTLTFVPEKLPKYFPLITAKRIIRKNVAHVIKVGEEEKTSDEMQTVLQNQKVIYKEDRWWIPAAILGAIGIIAIVIYYAFLSK